MQRHSPWPAILALACILNISASCAKADDAGEVDLLVAPSYTKLAPLEQLAKLADCKAKKQAVRDEHYLQFRAISIYVWEQGAGDVEKELLAFAKIAAMAQPGKPLEPLAPVIEQAQSIMRYSLVEYLSKSKIYQAATDVGKAKIIADVNSRQMAAGPFAESIMYMLMVDAQAKAAGKLPVAQQGLARLKVLKDFSAASPKFAGQSRALQIQWSLLQFLLHNDAWNKPTATAADKVKLLRTLRDQGLLGTPSGLDDVYSGAVLPWIVTMLEDQGFLQLDVAAREAVLAKLLKDNVLDQHAMTRLQENFADDAHRIPIENMDLILAKDVDFQGKDPVGRLQLLQQRATKLALIDPQLVQARNQAFLEYLQAGDDATPQSEMAKLKPLAAVDKRRNGWSLLNDLYNGSQLREGLGFEIASVVFADPLYRGDATSRAVATAKLETKTFESGTPTAMQLFLMTQMVIDKTLGAKFDHRGEERLRAQTAVGYAVPLWGLNLAWAGTTALDEYMWDNAEFRDGTLTQKAAFIADMQAKALTYNGSQFTEAIWLTRYLEADKTFMGLLPPQKRTAIEKMVTDKQMTRLAAWEVERGMGLN